MKGRVVGAGYVGLTSAVCLAERNHDTSASISMRTGSTGSAAVCLCSTSRACRSCWRAG